MAIDVEVLRARARRRLEWGRLKAAFAAASLLWPIMGLVIWLAPEPARAAVAVAISWLAMWLALWWGRALGAGVLPGAVCAMFPLISTYAAGRIGHLCVGDGCYDLCAPLCSAGGALAGLILAVWLRHRPGAWRAYGVGAFIILSVGTTGCTCIGMGGVMGVVVGLALGVTPMLWTRPYAPST